MSAAWFDGSSSATMESAPLPRMRTACASYWARVVPICSSS